MDKLVVGDYYYVSSVSEDHASKLRELKYATRPCKCTSLRGKFKLSEGCYRYMKYWVKESKCMKHKIGDRVRIKSASDIRAEKRRTGFGSTGWEEDMYDYCGEEHIIKDIINSTEYMLVGVDWLWTDDMFGEEISYMERSPACFKMIQQSLLSLGEACARVGGIAPNLNMTLEEFLNTYGWNGVGFCVLKEKQDQMNRGEV